MHSLPGAIPGESYFLWEIGLCLQKLNNPAAKIDFYLKLPSGSLGAVFDFLGLLVGFVFGFLGTLSGVSGTLSNSGSVED